MINHETNNMADEDKSDIIELNYYESDKNDRTERFFGVENFERLQNSNILIVGAGAIGNEVVKNLALLGVKQLRLVDFDNVSESNTNRCLYFSPADHGRPKVEVIKERVESQYDTIIHIYNCRIEEAPEEVWMDLNLLIVGVDNDMARLLINAKVLSLYIENKPIPVINGAMGRTFIECEVLTPGYTACLTCLWSESYKEVLMNNEVLKSCDEFFLEILPKFPAISTFTSVIGGIMSSEAAKLLILPDTKYRLDQIGIGYLIRHDLELYEYTKGFVMRNPRCTEPFCSGTFNRLDYSELWKQHQSISKQTETDNG